MCVEQLEAALTRGVLRTCAGQHEDLASQASGRSVDPDTWLEIAAAKSGEPLAWACWAGALVGGAGEDALACYRGYGCHLGILLQVADDHSGVWCAREGSDLGSGRVTLPTSYALLTKVLVLTAYDDEIHVRGAVAAGAAGYVLKDEAPEALVRAIRAVACGDGWFSRPALDRVLQAGTRGQCEAPGHGFSEREWQILGLIAEGWDNARIARELELARQTVRNYASRIYARLGVHSRAEAIVWARRRGAGEE